MGLASAPLAPPAPTDTEGGSCPFWGTGRSWFLSPGQRGSAEAPLKVPQTEKRTPLPDGIGWGEWECSADKVPQTVIFIAKKTNKPSASLCAQFPSRACPSHGHTMDLTIPVDQF